MPEHRDVRIIIDWVLEGKRRRGRETEKEEKEEE